jgi:hypothetical protein
MSKIFVIAGTSHEANYWIINHLGKRFPSNTSASMSDYVYVSSPDKLKGIRDPHGVFVGNWLGRPDILEIVEALMLASVHVNPALGKIYKDLKSKVRPTPKQPPLHKVAGGYAIAVQDAAELLAREIDNEVLKSLMKTAT